jgi:hypothetical protein
MLELPRHFSLPLEVRGTKGVTSMGVITPLTPLNLKRGILDEVGKVQMTKL